MFRGGLWPHPTKDFAPGDYRVGVQRPVAYHQRPGYVVFLAFLRVMEVP